MTNWSVACMFGLELVGNVDEEGRWGEEGGGMDAAMATFSVAIKVVR